MNRVCSGHIAAGMMSQDFSEFVKSLIAKNDVYNFMPKIKSSPGICSNPAVLNGRLPF